MNCPACNVELRISDRQGIAWHGTGWKRLTCGLFENKPWLKSDSLSDLIPPD